MFIYSFLVALRHARLNTHLYYRWWCSQRLFGCFFPIELDIKILPFDLGIDFKWVKTPPPKKPSPTKTMRHRVSHEVFFLLGSWVKILRVRHEVIRDPGEVRRFILLSNQLGRDPPNRRGLTLFFAGFFYRSPNHQFWDPMILRETAKNTIRVG